MHWLFLIAAKAGDSLLWVVIAHVVMRKLLSMLCSLEQVELQAERYSKWSCKLKDTARGAAS